MGKVGDEARSQAGCLLFFAAPLLAGLGGFLVGHVVAGGFGGWDSLGRAGLLVVIAAMFGTWMALWVGLHKLLDRTI